MVKLVAKFVIELCIAIVLFFVLVKYTPVFDDLLPGTVNEQTEATTQQEDSKDNTSQNPTNASSKQSGTSSESTTTIAQTNTQSKPDAPAATIFYNEYGTRISQRQYLAQNFAVDTRGGTTQGDDLIVAIQKFQQQKNSRVYPQYNASCSTPWGTSIAHGESVIAYHSSTSRSDNLCNGQTRYCNNGRLSGTYTQQSCDYLVDGKQGDVTIIEGADDSVYQVIVNYTPPPVEYIQPTHATDEGKTYTMHGLLQTNKNKTKPSIVYTNGNNTSPIYTPDDEPKTYQKPSTKSCATPWGKTVEHGTFVYAYQQSQTNGARGDCQFEKRACLDGKLSGTYQHKACTHNDNGNYNMVINTNDVLPPNHLILNITRQGALYYITLSQPI